MTFTYPQKRQGAWNPLGWLSRGHPCQVSSGLAFPRVAGTSTLQREVFPSLSFLQGTGHKRGGRTCSWSEERGQSQPQSWGTSSQLLGPRSASSVWSTLEAWGRGTPWMGCWWLRPTAQRLCWNQPPGSVLPRLSVAASPRCPAATLDSAEMLAPLDLVKDLVCAHWAQQGDLSALLLLSDSLPAWARLPWRSHILIANLVALSIP